MARDTSIAAMRHSNERAPNLRTRCLRVIQRELSTADEVAAELHESVLSVRPQITLLSKENKIRDSRLRRINASGRDAIVWAANPPEEWTDADDEGRAEKERKAIIAFMRGPGNQLKRGETIAAIERGDHLKCHS